MSAFIILLFSIMMAWVMYRFGYNLKHWRTVREWEARQKEMAKKVEAYFQRDASAMNDKAWKELNNELLDGMHQLSKPVCAISSDWKAVWSKSAIYKVHDQYVAMFNAFLQKSEQHPHVYSPSQIS